MDVILLYTVIYTQKLTQFDSGLCEAFELNDETPCGLVEVVCYPKSHYRQECSTEWSCFNRIYITYFEIIFSKLTSFLKGDSISFPCYVYGQIDMNMCTRSSPLAVNITVHNSVLLNSNTNNCAFILHCVVYYVETTELSCDCYYVGLLWQNFFLQTINLNLTKWPKQALRSTCII